MRWPLSSWLLLPLLAAVPAQAETVYFQVSAPCCHDDAYVLPLEAAADIAYARAIISGDPSASARIVVAQIEAGADGINRDLLAPGQPAWNWHVASFTTFAEVTIELCDGGPGFVENDVAGWMANTGGQICFWSYTVTAELPGIAPLPASRGLGALLGLGLLVVVGGWVRVRRAS